MTLAIIMAVPTTAFYGSVEFPNLHKILVGIRCSKLKIVNKAGSLAGAILVVIVILVSMTAMICFSSKIGKKVNHHFKY